MQTTKLFLWTLVSLACACRADDRATVWVTYRPTGSLVASSSIDVSLDAAQLHRVLQAADVGNTANAASVIDTPTSGTLALGFTIHDGTTIAGTGLVSVDLRADWAWGFVVAIDSLNPASMCFGCSSSKSFPLAAVYRRNPRDSIWVTWGGNSIRNPVVY